jgi:formylglycine-generating enzyme required for sulfatase activity
MKYLFLVLFICGFASKGVSNNISVTSVALTGQNTTAGLNNANNFTLVQFNLSWENSHRVSFGPTNWDAAWVFVKYKVSGTTDWNHARLNNSGHTAPVGSTIDIGLTTPGTVFNSTTNPGVGAFIYRSTVGTGTFTANAVQLRWNYGANGIADNAVIEVQVYAIEMIFVPSGAFNAGGGGGNSAFTSTTINTAVATTVPSGVGSLGGQAGGYPTGQTAPIASFPNGFGAFYTMKYEISQQQYVDFLNNLNTTSASARFPNNLTSRNGISLGTGVNTGIYVTTSPAVACNFLGWADFAAYLDWSGLRPMTELEFEKASRGTISPVINEFAWGTASSTAATGFINGGLPNEAILNAGANASFNGLTTGPLRVGIFAGTNTTRTQAGATYYGAMEFSGNLWERSISLASPEGRLFSGIHGDGKITSLGLSDVLNWPSNTTSLGAGLKGGAWIECPITTLGISDRQFMPLAYNDRYRNTGGRGVRTAP